MPDVTDRYLPECYAIFFAMLLFFFIFPFFFIGYYFPFFPFSAFCFVSCHARRRVAMQRVTARTSRAKMSV